MASSTLNIGNELHGESLIYRIESVLGQGSFGITYKAKAFTVIKGKFGEELVETSRPKAIKEFFMKEVNERDASGSITGMSEGSLSYNYAQKFKKEAENLASMNHPNIVKVIDFISANNTYYYVMDFIEGENLNDYLKSHKLSEEDATSIIIEVAKALKYMHEEKHMLHLDLKPGNIMRRESDGHIFLIDFGLSKHYSDDGVPETSTSIGLGTPGYAPIEQANSKNAKQFRTTLDVYALGATFYKLLTGQTPPLADELVSDEDYVRNKLIKTGIREELVEIVSISMILNVKQRVQTVADFCDKINNTGNVFDKRGVDNKKIPLKPDTSDKSVASPNDTSYIISPYLKYRYYLGMVINIGIGLYVLFIIINGGKYDPDWDYHYSMVDQWMITLTCFVSALLEYLHIRGRWKVFRLFLLSNILFWFFAISMISTDSKTGITHFEIGIFLILILWLVTSLTNYFVDKYGRIKIGNSDIESDDSANYEEITSFDLDMNKDRRIVEAKDVIVEEVKKDVLHEDELKGAESPEMGSNFGNIFKFYIPSALTLCCIIVLIILHSNYTYVYWWVDEEYVIGGALIIFIAVLLLYYIIVKRKIYGNK